MSAFIRFGGVASVALAALLALAPAAWAGRLVALKAEVSSGASVTLGDLFDGAGGEAPVVVGSGAPPGQSAVLDAAVVRELARRHGLDWDNPAQISRIVVPRATVAAPGARTVEVLTYAQSLSTGEMIQPDDLTYGKIASFAVPPDAPHDANQVIGKVARRPLRAGAAVASRDVGEAQVIKAGDTVQVIYRADGISLVLQGVAMGPAAVGDAVSIMNPVSKKAIQAIASGVDEAVVGPEAEQIPRPAARRRSTCRPPLRMNPMRMKFAAVLALAAPLAACGSAHEALYGPGAMSPIAYPVALAPTGQGVLPISAVAREPLPQPASANSIWRTGAREFLGDQRASRVGDILTVLIQIDDSAKTSNDTTTSKTSANNIGIPNFLGLESSLGRILPKAFVPSTAIATNTSLVGEGKGATTRQEQITLTIAAVVTQVLPNGNLVIQGRQEVETNYDTRVLTVAGIVRPEDITAANTILHTQIAEARISYGGKGDIAAVQKTAGGTALLQRYTPF